MNVLVRIPYQKIFYREGFVQAGRPILFLDSLNGGNRGGIHWDYANPPGGAYDSGFCEYRLPTHYPHSAVGWLLRAIWIEPRRDCWETVGAIGEPQTRVNRGDDSRSNHRV